MSRNILLLVVADGVLAFLHWATCNCHTHVNWWFDNARPCRCIFIHETERIHLQRNRLVLSVCENMVTEFTRHLGARLGFKNGKCRIKHIVYCVALKIILFCDSGVADCANHLAVIRWTLWWSFRYGIRSRCSSNPRYWLLKCPHHFEIWEASTQYCS